MPVLAVPEPRALPRRAEQRRAAARLLPLPLRRRILRRRLRDRRGRVRILPLRARRAVRGVGRGQPGWGGGVQLPLRRGLGLRRRELPGPTPQHPPPHQSLCPPSKNSLVLCTATRRFELCADPSPCAVCGQDEVNECGSSPCMHGGVCVDEVAAYSCRCEVGFGKHLPHDH